MARSEFAPHLKLNLPPGIRNLDLSPSRPGIPGSPGRPPSADADLFVRRRLSGRGEQLSIFSALLKHGFVNEYKADRRPPPTS
jgi:hypothetical protein